jgi:Rod binding domain-containing protein
MSKLLGPASIAAVSSAASAATEVPTARIAKAVAKATPEDAAKVGRQFEQMFLAQMLGPMFSGIDTDGPFGGGSGEQMMRSFQIDAFANSIVSRGGIGLAQNVAREVLRLQEKQNV